MVPLRDASDGDVIILPQNDHDGHYYLLKEPENELELLDFMQAIKDGKAERHGTSAIGRFVSDFLNGFIRLFKENPILGSLIGKFIISRIIKLKHRFSWNSNTVSMLHYLGYLFHTRR